MRGEIGVWNIHPLAFPTISVMSLHFQTCRVSHSEAGIGDLREACRARETHVCIYNWRQRHPSFFPLPLPPFSSYFDQFGIQARPVSLSFFPSIFACGKTSYIPFWSPSLRQYKDALLFINKEPGKHFRYIESVCLFHSLWYKGIVSPAFVSSLPQIYIRLIYCGKSIIYWRGHLYALPTIDNRHRPINETLSIYIPPSPSCSLFKSLIPC